MASKKVRVKKKTSKAIHSKSVKKKRKSKATGTDAISQLADRLVHYVNRSTGRIVASSNYGKKAFPIAREPGASTRPGDKKKSQAKKRHRTS